LLKEADAFVLTPYSEGQPMAVIEALVCGAPVLITTPWNELEVAEFGAGFVVPAAIESIIPALTDILREDRFRENGQTGQRVGGIALHLGEGGSTEPGLLPGYNLPGWRLTVIGLG
jgi:glycosyltransferase involved in cell wall biosynthesis